MSKSERIGKTLRKLRSQSGLSANDVSLILKEQYNINMNHRTLFNYEKGRSSPDIDRFLCLCMVYGCADILYEFNYVDFPRSHLETDDETCELLNKYYALPESGKDLIRGALGMARGMLVIANSA